MFVILSLVVSFGLLIWGIVKEHRGEYDDGFGEKAVGIVFSAFFAIIWIIIAMVSQGESYQLKATYYNLTGQYQYAITDTQILLTPSVSVNADNSTVLIPIQGSIEKIGVGSQVANQITDLRNEVSKYNNSLITLREWKTNFWLGILYPEVDSSLKPMAIKIY